MDLSDALGGWPSGDNQSGGGGGAAWPGQPANPTWPGGQPANPTWPGGQPANPTWPAAPSGPSAPSGPGWPAPTQPSGPGWPAPTQPSGPGWPAPTQPSGPGWPSAPSGPSQPSNPTWPSQPTGPTGPTGPSGPGGWPSGPAPGPAPSPSFPVAPQQNLTMPYSQKFPSGLKDKTLITIAGTIKPRADKFIVDFRSHSDLVFHFNPRFNESGRQVIVRNSEIGRKWGKEERDLPRFPFTPGQAFEMKIMVTRDSFKVAVNNSHLLEFKHRERNLHNINHMAIHHDLVLSRVTVETLP